MTFILKNMWNDTVDLYLSTVLTIIKFIILLFTVFNVIVYFSYAHAAPLNPADRGDIEQQQRDILLQNQQQREDLERNVELKPIPQTTTPEISGPCFSITQIDIAQATKLSEKDKNQLTQPYINQCIGISQISKLVEVVSEWYISRGYITSRAFLTEQDLSSGTLNIWVLEGKLEKVLLEGESTTAVSMAFPGLEGKIFNLRDIEQGMEQINRVRTVPVQIEILPGSEQGLSVVSLSAAPEFPLSFTLGFDNSGQKSTGTGQMNTSITGNNLLRIAD